MASERVVGYAVLIDSEHRLNKSDAPNSFDIDLTNPDIKDPSAVVAVKDVCIPLAVYNVSEGLTDTLTFTEDVDALNDDIDLFITITPGDYNGNQLASAIKTAMNVKSDSDGHDIVYNVTYNARTARFTWSTATANRQFRLVFPPASTTCNSMCRLLGFPIGNTTAYGSDGATLISTNVAQLQPVNRVEIYVADTFGGLSTESPGTKSGLLCSVLATVAYGGLLQTRSIDSDESYFIRELFGRKHITLKANFGQGRGSVLLPGNGGDWSFQLMVRGSLPPDARAAEVQRPNKSQYKPLVS